MSVSTVRPRVGRTIALVAALLALAAVPAQAQTTSDVNNWALGPTTTEYGAPAEYHVGSTWGGVVEYRWLDSDMTKTTVISGNTCSDYALYGKSTFYGGDTSYHRLFTGSSGWCFILRGRTESGTTIPHDGRVRR